MSSLIEFFEIEEKKNKYFGIRFGIYSEDYETDRNVEFGDNTTFTQCGNEHNYQPILLDNKQIGVLEEVYPYNVLKPTRHSFKIYVKEDYKTDSPHFFDEEFGNVMSFATLQDAITFYENNKNIVE